MWQRPLIVSAAAMVAGGDNGLPWLWAGRQWLLLPVAIKKGGNYGPYVFLSLTNTTGAKITPFSPTLLHRTPPALRGSVEKNTDSLVKGMILFDQGGGGRGGGERSWSKVPPPVSPWSACFCCCLLFLILLFLSRAHKYWRETHLLDPLALAGAVMVAAAGAAIVGDNSDDGRGDDGTHAA